MNTRMQLSVMALQTASKLLTDQLKLVDINKLAPLMILNLENINNKIGDVTDLIMTMDEDIKGKLIGGVEDITRLGVR